MRDPATERPHPPPLGPSPTPRWGITWHGTASPEAVTHAIEAVSKEMGMRCQQQALPSGTVEIETIQESSWTRTLIGLLPQKVLWRIETRGQELTVTADFRAFLWFQALVLSLFALGLSLPLACVWTLNQPWIAAVPGLRPVLGLVAVLAPCLVVAIPTLLGALGGGWVGMSLWQPVVERVERTGGALEPTDSGVSRRYLMALVAMALLLGAAVSPLVWVGLQDVTWYQPVTLISLTLLTALEGVTLVGVWILARRRGAGLRAEPVLVGVVTSASILFLLLPVLFLGWAGYDDAALENIQRSNEAAGWGAGVLVFLGLLVSAGLFLTANGIRLSISGWLVLKRMQQHRDRGVYRQAVQGGALLRLVRQIFVGIWALSAVLLVGGLSLVGLLALGSIGWLPVVPETGMEDILAAALAFVLGLPWKDPVLSALTHVAYLLYSLGLVGLFGFSVGQLWWARRRTRHDLLEAMPGDSPEHLRLQKTTADLCEKAGVTSLRLAIRDERTIEAYSHAFGLLRQERFIEVSEGALRHLTEEELRALIAHEMVHHLRGDVRIHNRLRWLGRLTFVGDGFVRALLDSVGDEAEADRAAVSELGASPEALLRCLWKIRNVNRFAQQEDRALPDGPPVSLERPLQASENWRKLLTEELKSLTWKERWRWAWRLFVWQYFVPMDLHYWHPGRGDRESALEALMETKADA